MPPNDKHGTVRKYFKLLNEKFILNYEKAFSTYVSTDETMVPYYGRHSLKQHIHGKPLRFGYKLCSAATRQRYLINSEHYQHLRLVKVVWLRSCWCLRIRESFANKN